MCQVDSMEVHGSESRSRNRKDEWETRGRVEDEQKAMEGAEDEQKRKRFPYSDCATLSPPPPIN